VAARAMRGETDRPFVGRPEVLMEVDRALDDAATPQAHGLLLVGPDGIGKSEVARVAAGRAADRGFRTVRGRGLPEEIAPPLSLVREIFSALSSPADEPVYDPATGGFSPGAGAFEKELGAETPGARTPGLASEGLESLLAPGGRTSIEGLGAARDALRRRFVDECLARKGTRSLAVVVDDLPLADALSLDLLNALAREGNGKGIVVFATGTTGAIPAGADRVVRRLTAEGVLKEVVLRPLSVSEVGEFASWLLGGTRPSAEDVLRWHTQTGGNPLCLELLVRSVAGASLRSGPTDEAGGDVLAAVIERARALEGVDRRVLTYASVFGREFAFPKLQTSIGLAEEIVSESLDRLVRQGFLRERGAEVYEFVSERLWATVYTELTETRRMILHRKIATALEGRPDVSDFELARHFYIGRNDPKAVEYNLRSADGAARAYAFETALSLVRRALEAARRIAPRDLRQEVRLLTETGRLLNEIGDLPAAEETLNEAVLIARQEHAIELDLGRALLALAWTRIERSAYREAEPFALEAEELLGRAGGARDVFAAHRALGTLYWRLSDLARAEHHQRAALAIAEREGNPHERGHALVDVANTLLPRGPEFVDATLALYEEAAEQFGRLDDPSASARVRMNRAVLLHRVGRTEEALRDIEIALDAAERSRSPIWIGYCLLNLGQWQAELGRTTAAAELIDRAERTLAPTGDQLAVQQVQMIRGLIAEREGRFEDAERRYAESQETARRMGTLGELAELLFRRARLAARCHNPGRARELVAEARSSGLAVHRIDLLPEVEKLEVELGSP
jgi:tetratricopeptide (TPR) repeat protein